MKGSKNFRKMGVLSAVVLSMFLLSVYSGEVAAVHGMYWPPFIVMNPIVKIFEMNTASSSFEVTNLDSASAEVFISPNNNLNDYVDIKTPYVYLEPGESRTINFDIAVKDALQHTGDIFVTFKDSAVSYSYLVNLKIYPVGSQQATNNLAPSAPTGLTPRADYCKQDVTVAWTASTDPDTATLAYEFEFDNNNDFSTKISDGIVVGTEKTFHLDPGLYFWRIRAFDGKFYSAWVTSSFKINSALQCMDKMAQLEARIEELENRVGPLETLVNAIKAAVCSLGDFGFCSGTPAECAGTDLECGAGGVCQNCNLQDGCYSGYYRNYGCSSQSCQYTSSCTEACCDAVYQDPAAFCSAGVCNAPPGQGCTDECVAAQKRCSDNYAQTCGNYNADTCTEWNTGTLCVNGCLNGACQQACFAKGTECTTGSECCSGTCSFGKTCISYDLRGISSRYTYKWACA